MNHSFVVVISDNDKGVHMPVVITGSFDSGYEVRNFNYSDEDMDLPTTEIEIGEVK